MQSANDINEVVIKSTSLFSTLIDKHALYQGIRVSEKFCPYSKKNHSKQAPVRNNSMSLIITYRNVRNQVTKKAA